MTVSRDAAWAKNGPKRHLALQTALSAPQLRSGFCRRAPQSNAAGYKSWRQLGQVRAQMSPRLISTAKTALLRSGLAFYDWCNVAGGDNQALWDQVIRDAVKAKAVDSG